MKDIALALSVVGFVFAEVLLFLFMSRWYFSFGLPLFRKRLSAAPAPWEPPRPEQMSKPLSESPFSRLLFRRISETELAFREELFSLSALRISYAPLMRGHLRFARSSREVVVTGHANLWLCALILYLGGQGLAGRDLGTAAFILSLGGVCYALQRSRFTRVAEVAVEEWGKGEAGNGRES